tara:strand:- start:175 stop:537 length:363 start_codon:yes stop_codon:yes gene_type:complete
MDPTPIKPDIFDDVVFSIEITGLEKTGSDEIVTIVRYNVVGVYNEVSAEHSSQISFMPEEVSVDDAFIPFENLSEAQVKSWVEERYPEIAIKYSIANNIADCLTHKESIALPWNKEKVSE